MRTVCNVLAIWLAALIATRNARKIPDIVWRSDNEIFQVSNTDHVIGVNIGDRVSIKCPKSSMAESYEYSYIYMVSEEEYNHCFLHSPRLVGACDNETSETSVNIVFRSFTPTPGGFEFRPGKTYYLISTSDGSIRGIDRKKDGLCLTRQMKIKFVVSPEKGVNEPSPKFAARTFKKDRDVDANEAAAATTPVMYMIHNEKEAEAESADEDDADGSLSMSFSMLALILPMLINLLN